MHRARCAPLTALLAAVLGTVALAVAPAGAGAAPVDAADADPGVVVDLGPARTNPLDPALVPPAMVEAAGGNRADGGGSAKVTEALSADGSSGFAVFSRRTFAYGAYRIQLVSSGTDGDVETLRAPVTEAAAQLTAITHLGFTVDPGVVARPTSVNRFGAGFCGSFGGHRCSLFADAEQDIGIIRIEYANGSPCGALVPSGGGRGTVGCGGPEATGDDGGNQYRLRGNVWVSPSVADSNADIATEVVAHEIGHTLGLDHYGRSYTAIPGGTPVRQLMYPSVHDDPSDTGLHYRTGDVNGIWWLQQPKAWYIGATYRDFLGRIPDPNGYTFWLQADVTPAQYVDSLAGSDEWIGRILTDFYADVFGRAPDPAGFAYWAGVVRTQGVPFVAAQLYGSNEYLQRQGGSVTGVVQGLYRQLLGRDAAADPPGLSFWVSSAAARGRVAVAYDFFQSQEKREGRVHDLYCSLLNRPPDAAGQAYWAGVILVQGDLALARQLATSQEFVANADDFTLRPLDAPPAC